MFTRVNIINRRKNDGRVDVANFRSLTCSSFYNFYLDNRKNEILKHFNGKKFIFEKFKFCDTVKCDMGRFTFLQTLE